MLRKSQNNQFVIRCIKVGICCLFVLHITKMFELAFISKFFWGTNWETLVQRFELKL